MSGEGQSTLKPEPEKQKSSAETAESVGAMFWHLLTVFAATALHFSATGEASECLTDGKFILLRIPTRVSFHFAFLLSCFCSTK